MAGRRLGGFLLGLVLCGLPGPARAAKNERVTIPMPPAGGMTIFVGVLHGKSRHLPKRFDLRKLFRLRQKKSLPQSIAIYAAARVVRSGADVTTSLAVFVLNPRTSAAATTRAAARGSSASVGPKGDALLGILLGGAGGNIDDEQLGLGQSDVVADGVSGPFNDIFVPGANVQPITGLGSYADGHAFGWEVTRHRPMGADNGPAVLDSIDAVISNLLDPLQHPELLYEEVRQLEAAAGEPAGSLGPPLSSSTTTSSSTVTTTSNSTSTSLDPGPCADTKQPCGVFRPCCHGECNLNNFCCLTEDDIRTECLDDSDCCGDLVCVPDPLPPKEHCQIPLPTTTTSTSTTIPCLGQATGCSQGDACCAGLDCRPNYASSLTATLCLPPCPLSFTLTGDPLTVIHPQPPTDPTGYNQNTYELIGGQFPTCLEHAANTGIVCPRTDLILDSSTKAPLIKPAWPLSNPQFPVDWIQSAGGFDGAQPQHTQVEVTFYNYNYGGTDGGETKQIYLETHFDCHP